MSTLKVDAIRSSGGSADGLTMDSSGRVLTPARPAFRAYNSGTSWIEITHNTTTIMAFNTTDYNIGSHYNTSTYKFTAPVSGLYYFWAIAYSHASGGTRYIYLYKNDARYSGNLILDSSGTGMSRTGQIYDVLNLAANDTVAAYYYHADDTASGYYPGSGGAAGTSSHFGGYLIG